MLKALVGTAIAASALFVLTPTIAGAQDPPPQNCTPTGVVFTRNSALETYSSLRDMPTLQAGDGISMAVHFEEDGNRSWRSCQFGLALYSHPDNSPERPHLGGELVDYQDHGTAWKHGPALFYSINIPENYCGLQLDAYRGKHLTMKDFQNGDRYGDRLISAKNQTNGDPSCLPVIATTTTVNVPTTVPTSTTVQDPTTTIPEQPTTSTVPESTTSTVGTTVTSESPSTTIQATTTSLTDPPSPTTIANPTTSTVPAGTAVRVSLTCLEIGRNNIPFGDPMYNLDNDQDRDGIACDLNQLVSVRELAHTGQGSIFLAKIGALLIALGLSALIFRHRHRVS